MGVARNHFVQQAAPAKFLIALTLALPAVSLLIEIDKELDIEVGEKDYRHRLHRHPKPKTTVLATAKSRSVEFGARLDDRLPVQHGSSNLLQQGFAVRLQAESSLFVVALLLLMAIALLFAKLVFMTPSASGEISAEDAERLMAYLKKMKPMMQLSSAELLSIVEISEKIFVNAGEVLVSQGAIGNDFYLILNGQASLSSKDEKKKEVVKRDIGPGSSFGESALLHNAKIRATVTVVTRLTVLRIRGEQFTELGLQAKLTPETRKPLLHSAGTDYSDNTRSKDHVPHKSKSQRDFLVEKLRSNESLRPLLEQLCDTYLKKMIKKAWPVTLKPGDEVMTEGDFDFSCVYLVETGTFEVLTGSTTKSREGSSANTASDVDVVEDVESGLEAETTLGPGDSFGQTAFLFDYPRAYTVRAKTAATLWAFDRADLQAAFLEQREAKLDGGAHMIDKVEVLSTLSDAQRRVLASALVPMHFVVGEQIYQQGDVGSSAYILVTGSVSVLENGVESKKFEASVGDSHVAYFGDQGLFHDDTRTATIKVQSDVAEAVRLDRESLEAVLGPLAHVSGTATNVRCTAPVQAKFRNIPMDDLQHVGLLGCGSLSTITLYEHKTSKEKFVLKRFSKGHIVETGVESQIVREKQALCAVESSFLLKVHDAYNWKDQLGLLLEPLCGGDLASVYIGKRLYGCEVHTRYYTACMVMALEHLHRFHVVHRDLKPENVVLNEAGVAKLTDFSNAKWLVGKTYTMCGTPEYIAPEIIQSAGHNQAVDWWSLGVVIFELMSGVTPFRAPLLIDICKKVVEGLDEEHLPSKIKGPVLDLIKGLMKKHPEQRLPRLPNGVDNIKKHEWFADAFTWKDIDDQTPACIPFIPAPLDTSVLDKNHQDEVVPYTDTGSGWDRSWTENT